MLSQFRAYKINEILRHNEWLIKILYTKKFVFLNILYYYWVHIFTYLLLSSRKTVAKNKTNDNLLNVFDLYKIRIDLNSSKYTIEAKMTPVLSLWLIPQAARDVNAPICFFVHKYAYAMQNSYTEYWSRKWLMYR